MRTLINENKKTTPIVILALLGIIVAGAALRLYQIGYKTVWLDEAFSIWLARQSVPDMIRLIIDVDQHPPLYYLLFHYWIQLGGVDASWVRGFSALSGTLAIPAIYLLGKRLGGAWVGLFSAFVMAINPFQVSYGQEVRTYAFLTLTVTVALWGAACLLTDPRSRTQGIGQQIEEYIRTWRKTRQEEHRQQKETGAGYSRDFRDDLDWVKAPTSRQYLPLQTIETDLAWLVYIVFTTITIYCHNTAFFFPLGINLFVFGLMLYRRLRPGDALQLQPPSLKNWFLAQVGVVLLWSPWLAAFIAQLIGVEGGFWIPKPDTQIVVDTLKEFFSAYLPQNIKWDSIIWLMFIGIILMGMLYFRKKPAHGLLLLAMFIAPVGGELLASLKQPIFYDRTLIWAPIPIYVLIGAGIHQLRFKPYILVACTLLVVVNALSLNDFYRYYEKERWDQAAYYVAQNVQDTDLILFNAGWTQIPFDYYFAGYDHKVDEAGLPATLFERGVLEPIMAESDLPRLRSLIRGRDRVWLVYSHNWYTDPKGLVPEALGQDLKLVDAREFYGMQVFLYGVR